MPTAYRTPPYPPEEPGLEEPAFFLDPTSYLGGLGGLIRRMATRTAYRFPVIGEGKPYTQLERIANLRRQGRSIQSTWQPKGRTEEEQVKLNYQKLLDQLNKRLSERR